MDWQKIENMQHELRHEWRIKRNVDYAVMHGYGETYLMCKEVYLDTVLEVAQKFNVQFNSVNIV